MHARLLMLSLGLARWPGGPSRPLSTAEAYTSRLAPQCRVEASASGHQAPPAATKQPLRGAAQAAGAPRQALQAALPCVVLKGGKSKLFSEGQSPMVYSGAVDRVVGRPAPQGGDTVLVCDGGEKPIGWGVYNPASMFRVRIMQTAEELFGGGALLQQRPDLMQLVDARVRQAVQLRAALGLRCAAAAATGGTGDAATTVFRLVNSEGDRLSGLIVDVLGQHLVVSSSGEGRSTPGCTRLARGRAGMCRLPPGFAGCLRCVCPPLPSRCSGLGGATACAHQQLPAPAHGPRQHCVATGTGHAERGGVGA